MNELFSMLESEEPQRPEPVNQLMTESQRTAIRHLFSQLGVSTAREQLEIVRELTGRGVNSVADVTQHHAQSLIYGLSEKVRTSGRKNTGNSWDDREEDTWIDKL